MTLKPDPSDLPVFFIIGRPRSGTTLIRHLLDAHPNILIPSECNFILALSGKYSHKKKFDRATLSSFLSDLRQTKAFSTLSIDNEQLEKNIMSAPENISYQQLCKRVHASYCSLHAKDEIKLIGDKNPAYSSENFNLIFSLFPASKYIHIVRDYRDQIVSLMTGDFKLPSPAFIAISWKKSMRTINRFKHQLPDSFYTLRYEDFVAEPEQQLQNICSFLGVTYHAEVFDYINKKEEYFLHQPNIRYKTIHKSLFNPVNRKRVGIWHEHLKGKQLAVIERIAGREGENAGYTKTTEIGNYSTTPALLKWYFLYNMFVLLRSFSFKLPLRKRNNIVHRLKNTKLLVVLYQKLIARKLNR